MMAAQSGMAQAVHAGGYDSDVENAASAQNNAAAMGSSFGDKAIRRAFIKKVYGILSIQGWIHLLTLSDMKLDSGQISSNSRQVIQGDTSGCSPGFVDTIANIAFQYKEHILKVNLCFDVN